MTSFGDLGRNYRVGGGVSPNYLYPKEGQLPETSPMKVSKESPKASPALEDKKPEEKPEEPVPKALNPLLGNKDLSNNPFMNRNTTIQSNTGFQSIFGAKPQPPVVEAAAAGTLYRGKSDMSIDQS